MMVREGFEYSKDSFFTMFRRFFCPVRFQREENRNSSSPNSSLLNVHDRLVTYFCTNTTCICSSLRSKEHRFCPSFDRFRTLFINRRVTLSQESISGRSLWAIFSRGLNVYFCQFMVCFSIFMRQYREYVGWTFGLFRCLDSLVYFVI